MQTKPSPTRIILVRHGESSFNVERRVQGHWDKSTLTDRGRETATQVGAALSELKFDAVYSSPLSRAKDTANLILAGLKAPPAQPLQTTDNLKEINLVLWEGMLFTEGINRALISTAVGLTPDRYQSIHQSNCGISVLNFAGTWGEPVQIESLNLTGHLGEPLPIVKKGIQGPRLLLVRHGETDWNRQKRFQGQIDVPLNEMGQLQAQQAGNFLSTVPIHHAVSSPLLRPKETAEIILQHHPDVPLELVDDLKEISHGLWEGALEAEIEQSFPGMLEQWQHAPETVQMPEGENLQQVWERTIAAWDGIVQKAMQRPGETTMVVAHDAVNKAILCYVLGLGPEYFWCFKQGNGAVSVIDYSKGPEKPVLTSMNITTHLGSVLDKTAAGAL